MSNSESPGLPRNHNPPETPNTADALADPVIDPIARLAAVQFSIPYLYPWQRLVIANILDAAEAGRAARLAAQTPIVTDRSETELRDDALFDEDGVQRGRQIVLLPTGAGKSLCFQIPAMALDGSTLVIYPLLALMGDQLRSLRERGIEPVLFRGGQTAEERDTQYRRMEGSDGKPPAKLIIANPEVLAGVELLERIAARKVAHLAIDEAHCVSEWGDTFRPSYLELGAIIRKIEPLAVTAFTATASPSVLTRIAEVLFDGRAHLVRGDSDRPNITYRVNHCRAKNAALIRETAVCERPAVVFCATRGGTERLAALLRDIYDDRDIRFYHAGLQKNEKLAVEAWFHGHDRAILITTCAWGMGVDKKNVRTVIHRDAPPTAEAYTQEAGRGGRDGLAAEAVLLWSPADAKRFGRLRGLQRDRAMVLARFAESGRCRREVLLEALGETRATSTGGGEQIACSGCDVCRGKAVQTARDAELVTDFISKNRRVYSRDEIIGILHSTGNRLSRIRFGRSIWHRSDFSGILDELENEKVIQELTVWPWKGKVTLQKKAK